jgi:hypothetical protein
MFTFRAWPVVSHNLDEHAEFEIHQSLTATLGFLNLVAGHRSPIYDGAEGLASLGENSQTFFISQEPVNPANAHQCHNI